MLMVAMIRKHSFFTSPALLLVALFVGAVAVVAAPQVSAISDVGPDPGEFGNGIRYALEKSDDVEKAGYAYIPVYYLSTGTPASHTALPPADMKIRVNDFGPRTNKNIQVNIGGRVVNDNVIGGTDYGPVGGQNGVSGGLSVIIPRESFTYRADINAWESYFITFLNPGGNDNRAQYRVHVQEPEGSLTGRGTIGKIGYSAKNGDNFAIANEKRCDAGDDEDRSGCGDFFDYNIPFGTPCSLTGSVQVEAKIYDGDNVAGSRYSAQGTSTFSVGVYDVTDSSSGDRVNAPGSGDSTSENNGTRVYTFSVEANHKYEFRLSNVYTNNVIQFKLPYDSITSIADCGYDVTPTVSLSATTGEALTGTLTGTFATTNPGPGASDNHTWQLNRCILPAGNTAYQRGIINNRINGRATYAALGANCGNAPVATDMSVFRKGTALRVGDIPSEGMPALQPGQRLCFVFSIIHPTDESDNDDYRHSKAACVLIGKKPKIQILGNDLFVGRLAANASGTVPTSAIQTSVSKNSSTYGSWVEYLASATGTITGIGTASGYAGGTNQSTCEASNLTLSNTTKFPSTTAPTVPAPAGCDTTTASFGGYKTNNTMPNVTGYFTTNVNPTPLTGNVDLATLSGTYKAGATLNITGGVIGRGKTVVINAPNTDVTISKNITYDGGKFTRIDEIPQVVIIAKNIYIIGKDSNNAVTNIDSWLVTSGTLNTCSDVAEFKDLTAAVCSARLTINGPVMADNLLLRRTGGASASDLEKPAEIFNLRPDAYLWGIAQSAKSGRLQSTYETELPPRY